MFQIPSLKYGLLTSHADSSQDNSKDTEEYQADDDDDRERVNNHVNLIDALQPH